MNGGVGYSWFEVELTSEPVGEFYDAGSGTITASGTGVEDYQPPYVPPVKPIVAPVASAKRKLRLERGEDRFPADFEVVETAIDRYRAGFEVFAGDRFQAAYAVIESERVTFAGAFGRSLRRSDEEAILALLLSEEVWE